MVKRSVILIFSVFIGISSLFAQDMKYSVPDKIKGKTVFTKILGKHNGYFFVVRYDKKATQNFLFEKYNSELKVVRNHEFNIESGTSVEDIRFMNGQLYFFYSEYEKQDKLHKLYCDVYDESFNQVDKENLIATTSVVPSNSKSFKIEYDLIYNQIVILYAESIVNDVIKFNILVLDDILTTLNSAHTRLNYSKEFSIKNIQLFNGQFTALVYEKTSGLLKGNKSNIDFFYYDVGNQNKIIRKLDFDSVKFENIAYRYDIVNKAYLFSGFYSSDNKEQIIGMGMYRYFVFNDSSFLKLTPFSDEMIVSISGKYDASGMLNYYPQGIVLRDDGGYVLISEYYSIQKEMQNDYYALNNTYVKYYYHYSDIMLVSVNADGQIDWNRIIRKDQNSMNDDGYYSSFSYATVANKIVILFNDFSRSKWNLLYHVIDPAGNVDFEVLVNGNTFNGSFIPRQAQQVGLFEIMVPALDQKRGFTLAKITIK
ncbi:MAG: hypothetical protein HOA61_17390 [Bacteroidetes bacterium]|nr:hypothetical protein [Bacteroidota bacterium]MBT7996897.1 hypothetical protein [Bacteroidota bacterium]